MSAIIYDVIIEGAIKSPVKITTLYNGDKTMGYKFEIETGYSTIYDYASSKAEAVEAARAAARDHLNSWYNLCGLQRSVVCTVYADGKAVTRWTMRLIAK